MRNSWFPDWKAEIFRYGKEIELLRGGIRLYAAQARPKIDAARAKKHPFRTEVSYILKPSTSSAEKSLLHEKDGSSGLLTIISLAASFFWNLV